MLDYWQFYKRERLLVSFGVVLALFSSFGQTFLVSLFVPALTGEFELSSARFGALYSGATLASAILLPWAGRWIDRIRLDRVAGGVILLMTLSALLMAASWSVWVLVVALVGIRLSGQGLSGHTALTTMARYYPRARGKALSLASLGFPLGEAIFPLAVTTLIGLMGWRASWLVIAGASVVVFLPLALWMIVRAGVELDPKKVARSEAGDAGGGAASRVGSPSGPSPSTRHWTRREVLADLRFQLVLPAALLPPFWATGLILYQTVIAAQRGWGFTLMASAFVAFALARIVFSLVVGSGIDRLSARLLFPVACLPMAAGALVLLWVESPWAAYAFMGLLGTTVGLSGNLKSALWAELYGVRHLGAIKGMMASLMVLSTALAPVLVGWVLELDGGLALLLWGVVGSVVVATLMALVLIRPDAASGSGGRI